MTIQSREKPWPRGQVRTSYLCMIKPPETRKSATVTAKNARGKVSGAKIENAEKPQKKTWVKH